MDRVWLVTCGDGSDGDEWNVLGIYRSKEAAEAVVSSSLFPGFRYVEEWPVHDEATTYTGREA